MENHRQRIIITGNTLTGKTHYTKTYIEDFNKTCVVTNTNDYEGMGITKVSTLEELNIFNNEHKYECLLLDYNERPSMLIIVEDDITNDFLLNDVFTRIYTQNSCYNTTIIVVGLQSTAIPRFIRINANTHILFSLNPDDVQCILLDHDKNLERFLSMEWRMITIVRPV